jgi:hypothetical protein
MTIFKALNLNAINGLPTEPIRKHRIDILIAIGLAIAIAISTHLGTYRIPDPIFTDFYAQDVWFGSDIPTVFGNITSFNSDFGRNNKHPLFPLIVFPLVFGLSKLLHLEPLSAARLVVVGVAILWIVSLYALLRIVGCHRLDATLFSILGGISAASMFWLVIPESFSFGSLSILLGLIFVTVTQLRQFSSVWYIAANVLTVSITITNLMVGLLATLVNHRLWKTIQIAVSSILVATGLWIVQRIAFTNSGFPFQPGTFIGEKKFISAPGSGGFLAVLSSFFYQTLILPAVQVLNSPIRPNWVKFETNHLSPGSGGLWGIIAVIAWTGLLGLGLWAFFAIKQHRKLRIVLGLTLAAQLLMHSIYGVEETFIYSLHFAPLLLTLAAFSLLTRFRILSLFLVAVLIVSAGINNRAHFNRIADALWNYGTPHQQVEAQMKLRPNDPWPRSVGHVVLAKPGSSVENKAFYEPGGSFSPQPGSFGVSIWVIDRQGNIKSTSDRIPLNEIQQKLIHLKDREIPGISTKTPHYEASWSSQTTGGWNFNLKPLTKGDTQLVAVVRSVGPAGGEIPSLAWNGQRLLISDRWTVKNIPKLAKVYLGSEGTLSWHREKSPRTHWEDPKGWGYARIELPQGESLNVQIEDNQPTSDPSLKFSKIQPNLTLDLPNPQFMDSLQAQIAHLMMGLVGTRTRPGDPIDYPQPRFRDGAYQMVALARAGQVDVAKQLSTYFAENDFINTTLPEADIPALGIWALEEVAIALKDPNYDRWLWPHIHRKAELIENMLSSNRPGYAVFKESKVPFSENADLIRTDLIAGKIDIAPGEISLNPAVNSISYRALEDAATLADRMKQPNEAKHWRTQAKILKTSWQKANQMRSSEFTNDLWPSWIAASDLSRTTLASQKQTQKSSDNISAKVNFNVTEAHQWLLLDRPEKVWTTLEQLWKTQDSPGLYTWSDRTGTGAIPMPKSFSQWHRFRGWIASSNLTPHYQTSAEVLLLQLDMLTYMDESPNDPTLVIGAGIPKDWLNKPIKVTGQSVKGNLINWSWDGNQMKVQIQDKLMKVKLGPAFPPTTAIKVEAITKPTITKPKKSMQ